MTFPPFWLCLHEVAHAGAHLVLNARLPQPETQIVEVRVNTDTDTGRCRYRWRGTLDPRRHAVSCLSGYAAECRHLHGPNWYPDATDLTTAPSPTKDVRMAQEALAALYWPDMEVLHAWTEARAIVSDNWPRLLRVAEMLQERLVLTGEDFEAAWHRCV